jgi:hypothetical protein
MLWWYNLHQTMQPAVMLQRCALRSQGSTLAGAGFPGCAPASLPMCALMSHQSVTQCSIRLPGGCGQSVLGLCVVGRTNPSMPPLDFVSLSSSSFTESGVPTTTSSALPATIPETSLHLQSSNSPLLICPSSLLPFVRRTLWMASPPSLPTCCPTGTGSGLPPTPKHGSRRSLMTLLAPSLLCAVHSYTCTWRRCAQLPSA